MHFVLSGMDRYIKRGAISDYTLDIIFYVHETPTTVPSKKQKPCDKSAATRVVVDILQDRSAALNLRNIGVSFIGEWHRDYMRALFILHRLSCYCEPDSNSKKR